MGWDCLAYKSYWCYCGSTIFLRCSVDLNGLWVIRLHYVIRSVIAYVQNVVNYLTRFVTARSIVNIADL